MEEHKKMRRDTRYTEEVAELARLTAMPAQIIDFALEELCSPNPEKQDTIIKTLLTFHRSLNKF